MRYECRSIEPLLHDYVEGWLDARLSAVAEQHLQVCPVCRAKVAGWQTVATALQELPQLPAPAVSIPTHAPEPRVLIHLAVALCALLAVLIVWQGHTRQLPTELLDSSPLVHAVQTYTTTIRERLAEVQRIWKAL
ncbi:MAG: zf-HC2 domain-containing protein [Armatimonadota bacterium]|nr:zf-HC2 domain-containing protein [Armatimonadota bacterium]